MSAEVDVVGVGGCEARHQAGRARQGSMGNKDTVVSMSTVGGSRTVEQVRDDDTRGRLGSDQRDARGAETDRTLERLR